MLGAECGRTFGTCHTSWPTRGSPFSRLAKKLRSLAPKYTMREDNLFKRGYSMPLLRCLTEVEAKKALREVHEGVCGNHATGQSLALKLLRLGYFWRTLKKDSHE